MSEHLTKFQSENDMSLSFYERLVSQVTVLTEGEPDFIANTANISALLFEELNKRKNNSINWVGFYFMKNKQLVLGPFQGKIACVRIDVGKGVCGTAAQRKETIIVSDVHQFPGHIACDTLSNSEIVVPILSLTTKEILGVLDIDCLKFNGFDQEDKEGLEKIAAAIARLFLAEKWL
jgi:L-methionine (R)-S-oxide reductase